MHEIQGGAHAGALDAVRDVIGWNTVWDPINRRPYTSLSRNWVSQKFGGFGVWLDDIFYHALMAGMFDAEVARENLRAIYAGATAAGNLPCLVTGRDSWIDRTQPPIGSFICWMLHKRLGSRDLLQEAWPVLLANHDWWWRTRDGNGDGLVEYGTSPVGGGLYRGTKLAAKDESSMDNSPTHDEAKLDTTSWTLDSADVGLNSLLALDGEMLAMIARELGEVAEAERLSARAEALKARIADRLWDPERKVFANRLWSGDFVRSLAPTSFYPLLCGAATAGAGPRHGGAARRSREIRRRMAAALGHPRRSGLSRQCLLARAHLAAAEFPGLSGAEARGLPGRGEPAGGERLPALPRRMGGQPPLPREFRCRQRPRPRPARYRSLLRLGRADAGDRRGRDHRHHALGRLRGHP